MLVEQLHTCDKHRQRPIAIAVNTQAFTSDASSPAFGTAGSPERPQWAPLSSPAGMTQRRRYIDTSLYRYMSHVLSALTLQGLGRASLRPTITAGGLTRHHPTPAPFSNYLWGNQDIAGGGIGVSHRGEYHGGNQATLRGLLLAAATDGGHASPRKPNPKIASRCTTLIRPSFGRENRQRERRKCGKHTQCSYCTRCSSSKSYCT